MTCDQVGKYKKTNEKYYFFCRFYGTYSDPLMVMILRR